MQPLGKYELLETLDDLGAIPVGTLLTRVTGSFVEFSKDMASLLEDHLVEVRGDEEATRELISMGAKLEATEGLDREQVLEKLFIELGDRAPVADSVVILTKTGFAKVQKY